jgi:hypothetical protein
MTPFSREKLIGKAFAAGAILAVAAISMPPAFAADDFPIVGDIHIPMPRVLEDDGPLPPPSYDRSRIERPYEDRPYAQRPYAPGPYGSGSYVAIPRGRYERSAMAARPMLPPEQVVTVLRASGFSPLGRVTQRGWIYTIAALDRNGEDGRLIIDARTGQIMRFIPAEAVDERMMTVYGPPGPPPAADVRYDTRRGALLDLRHAPRPPGSVPKAAKRSEPKAASRVATPATVASPSATPAAQQAAAPSAAKPVAESKSATTVGSASAAGPSTLKLWPTQAMPDVQPLD